MKRWGRCKGCGMVMHPDNDEGGDGHTVAIADKNGEMEPMQCGPIDWEKIDYNEYLAAIEAIRVEERERWWKTLQSVGIEVTDGGQFRADIESAIINTIRKNKVDKWINVKDQLPKSQPENRVQYLCWNGDEMFVAEYRDFADGPDFELEYGRPTHWMPLPKPPKE